MLAVDCSGTPYELGYQHGKAAKEAVARSIAFYRQLFHDTSKRSWAQVLETAAEFEPHIQQKWPKYHSEMQGIADGSSQPLLAILALNVRTEIAFGLFSDGCTSLFCRARTPHDGSSSGSGAFLGQNWDWMEAQKPNLLLLTLRQPGLPSIKLVTEAGIIGKIGLNSAGVGVCFNAIRARGVDVARVPAHLGLRRVLECGSAAEAVEALEGVGVASSCYMLVADGEGAVGMEFTSGTVRRQGMDAGGRICHANRLLEDHGDVRDDPTYLPDSRFRVERMGELVGRKFDGEVGSGGDVVSLTEFGRLFEDEENFPAAICRAQEGESNSATLFNIVMDLRQRRAIVRLGRPCRPEETYVLEFEDARA